MRRRQVLVGLGIVFASSKLARGQQTTIPVIAWTAGTPESGRRVIAGFRKGLAERGHLEGQHYRFDVRYHGFQYDRLPNLYREFVDQRVNLIIASTTATLTVAKATTQSIPIVFTIGSDPVENGFVASLNKPGGNITGTFTLNLALAGKRLELLHELLPSATKFAFLTNPASPKFNEPETREIQAAARAFGLKVVVVNARNPDEFEAAFDAASREEMGGIVIGSEAIFISAPSGSLTTLEARYRLPAIYGDEKPVTAEGGFISYGTDQDEGYRLVGDYVGRVLKGEKPADIPVQQSTKTKLVVNLRTAKAMGITVPTTLLVRADEVIE
jgi:putative ABC transport system substrate-binding protein